MEHLSLVILKDMQDKWPSGITEVHVLAYDPALKQQVWHLWPFSHICFMDIAHIFIVKQLCFWWLVILFLIIDSFLKYFSYFLVLFNIWTVDFIFIVWLEKWSGGVQKDEESDKFCLFHDKEIQVYKNILFSSDLLLFLRKVIRKNIGTCI